MRIALVTEDNKKEAKVSPHYGRCDYFGVYDSESLEMIFLANPFIKENGAGQKVTDLLLDNNIDSVIVTEIGAKALKKLHDYKMKAYLADKENSLIDNIYLMMEHKLIELKKGTKQNKHDHHHH